MNWLIDDQHLGQVLRGGRPPRPVTARDTLYTSGYWYLRLCQAIFGVVDRAGVLSEPFDRLPNDERDRALAAILELPEGIGLVSLRDLAPKIGLLRRDHALNVLGIEALAASIHIDAGVLLSSRAPRLETALKAEGCRYRVTPA